MQPLWGEGEQSVRCLAMEAVMDRSFILVGTFCAVALASSTALGFALRDRPIPAGAEPRSLEPSITDVSQGERTFPIEAVAPKQATMPPPNVSPAMPAMPSVTEKPSRPARDISEMTCRPYDLSAGTSGSHVMVCE